MRRPRVLFVGRTRYSLPLEPWLRKKFEALDRELDYRVLASAKTASDHSAGRFELMPPGHPAQLDGVLFHLRLPLRVRRALRSFGPDVVVAEDPPAAAAVLAARGGASRPRVVVEVHGNWRHATRLYGSPARRLLAPVADAVASFVVRRADAVRALSPYTASLVESVRGAGPDAVFPTWSDLSAFAGPPVPLPGRPVALFVGALELYKGLDTLRRAWPEVAATVPAARLVVVGRGSRSDLLDGLAAERVDHLPPEGVARRMDESWVLVLPSRHEGLGRVVIESLARGRGIVGTAAGGIPDLVEDGREGLLVEPGDAWALAEALRRVLADRGLAERLGAAAASRFDDWRTTPEEFAARVRALVEAALGA